MKTVVLGSRPPEIEALIEKRRRLGQDLFDEIWEGDYHMVPGPHGRHGRIDASLITVLWPYAKRAGLTPASTVNIGEHKEDFRVPDQAYFREPPDDVFNPTAAVVVEVRSADDESYAKFAFFASHEVDEVVVVEPEQRKVRWFARAGDGYKEVEHSDVLDADVIDIEALVDW